MPWIVTKTSCSNCGNDQVSRVFNDVPTAMDIEKVGEKMGYCAFIRVGKIDLDTEICMEEPTEIWRQYLGSTGAGRDATVH